MSLRTALSTVFHARIVSCCAIVLAQYFSPPSSCRGAVARGADTTFNQLVPRARGYRSYPHRPPISSSFFSSKRDEMKKDSPPSSFISLVNVTKPAPISFSSFWRRGAQPPPSPQRHRLSASRSSTASRSATAPPLAAPPPLSAQRHGLSQLHRLSQCRRSCRR